MNLNGRQEGKAMRQGEEEERAEERLEDMGPEDDPWEKPPSAGSDEDAASVHERCATERDAMTPRETADCAGTSLAEEYEREEDGGS